MLSELNLSVSGLADRSQAIQLGTLMTADAIVVIDREARSPWTRIRLIESRTGIRLWEDVKETSQDPSVVQRIAADLQSVGKKLRAPATSRRTVSVMGIVAESRDAELESASRSLQAFLERDLLACDDTVVLEREQLHHLVAERELTGVELELRSTAVLIEGSVRRGNGGQGLVVGIKLTRSDGSSVRSFEIQSDEPSLQPLRETALSEVLAALDAAPSGPRGGESIQFALRADWLKRYLRHAGALNAAYAALALSPTHDNLCRVRDLHAYSASRKYQQREWQPGYMALALEDAILAHQLDLRRLELGIREGSELIEKKSKIFLADPFSPHVPIGLSEADDVQARRATFDKIRLAKYQLLLEACADDSEDLLHILIPRLHLSAYFATGHEDYVATVLSLQADIDRALQRLPATSETRLLLEEQNAGALWFAMWLQTWHAMDIQVGGYLSADTVDGRYLLRREWKPEVIRPICEALRDHPAARLQLVVADHEVAFGGEAGLAAARRVFAQLRDEHTEVSSLVVTINRKCAHALQEAGELAALVEPLIAFMEQSKNLSPLWDWPGGISTILLEAEPQDCRLWSERILRLLPSAITAKSTERERYSARWLHDRLLENLPDAIPGSLELSAPPEGLWQNFKVSVFHAELPGLDQCILPDGPTSVPQLRLREIGSSKQQDERPTLTIPLDEQWRKKLQVDASPTELYAIPLHSNQIIAISNGQTRRLAAMPSQGPLQGSRPSLRWFRGKLYVARSGNFGSIDVATGDFTSLASSLATVPRHELDGGALFMVGGIFADELHECLWLSIYSGDRGGIWKYTPAKNSFEWLVQGAGSLCNWDEGRLVFRATRKEGLWHLLDTDSEVLTSLSGYRHTASRRDDQLRSPCIKVGPYIRWIDGRDRHPGRPLVAIPAVRQVGSALPSRQGLHCHLVQAGSLYRLAIRTANHTRRHGRSKPAAALA